MSFAENLIVLCRPGQQAVVTTMYYTYETEEDRAKAEVEAASSIVDGKVEVLDYPDHLQRPNLSVVVNHDGISEKVPYTHWGLVGNFYITRHDEKGFEYGLSEEEAEQVLMDLKDSVGYLDSRCGLENYFRRKGMDAEPPNDPKFFDGNTWPQYFVRRREEIEKKKKEDEAKARQDKPDPPPRQVGADENSSPNEAYLG